jgi:hypothetical protein
MTHEQAIERACSALLSNVYNDRAATAATAEAWVKIAREIREASRVEGYVPVDSPPVDM